MNRQTWLERPGRVLAQWRERLRTFGERAGRALTRFKRRESDEPGAATVVGWAVLPAEVVDEGERIRVRLEVPGLERDDFEILVEDDHLVVRGEKRAESTREAGDYWVRECVYGRFERVIPLPDPVDAGRAEARYRNGVLQVVLPKVAERRRRVRVRAA
ncbi:MAG: hypothetical protein KatS3mg121_1363 [Gammaproteobacteria bacterium]|nr:MAG: hypothetical protein KatS3mg121_1363 [Gammaproteobacteria bacterium]